MGSARVVVQPLDEETADHVLVERPADARKPDGVRWLIQQELVTHGIEYAYTDGKQRTVVVRWDEERSRRLTMAPAQTRIQVHTVCAGAWS